MSTLRSRFWYTEVTQVEPSLFRRLPNSHAMRNEVVEELFVYALKSDSCSLRGLTAC
jgi:(2Fe-2S) ferredoxin